MRHAVEDLVFCTSLHLLFHQIDLSLNHELHTAPLFLPLFNRLVLHETVTVILEKLAFGSNGAELDVNSTLLEISRGFHFQELAFWWRWNLSNKSFVNLLSQPSAPGTDVYIEHKTLCAPPYLKFASTITTCTAI